MTEPVIVPPRRGELQPCPFCGSEAGLEHDAVGSYAKWYVYCRDVRSSNGCPIGMTNTIGYARRSEAVAAWNTRAPVFGPMVLDPNEPRPAPIHPSSPYHRREAFDPNKADGFAQTGDKTKLLRARRDDE